MKFVFAVAYNCVPFSNSVMNFVTKPSGCGFNLATYTVECFQHQFSDLNIYVNTELLDVNDKLFSFRVNRLIIQYDVAYFPYRVLRKRCPRDITDDSLLWRLSFY